MHKSCRRMITMPHRPLGAVCCEASERAHKRMNNRAPTRPKPRPKRDPDPDPNQAMPTVHSHVISSIVFCLPCLLRGSRYATGSGLELGLWLGLALLINASSAGLVMELAHDMNVDMGSHICICICFVLPCTLTALHSSWLWMQRTSIVNHNWFLMLNQHDITSLLLLV